MSDGAAFLLYGILLLCLLWVCFAASTMLVRYDTRTPERRAWEWRRTFGEDDGTYTADVPPGGP